MHKYGEPLIGCCLQYSAPRSSVQIKFTHTLRLARRDWSCVTLRLSAHAGSCRFQSRGSAPAPPRGSGGPCHPHPRGCRGGARGAFHRTFRRFKVTHIPIRERDGKLLAAGSQWAPCGDLFPLLCSPDPPTAASRCVQHVLEAEVSSGNSPFGELVCKSVWRICPL